MIKAIRVLVSNLIAFLFVCLIHIPFVHAQAQSNLPPCTNRPFNNCFGAINLDRDFYSGEWQNDIFNGKGTYKFSSGTVYEGSWANGKRNGFGIEKYKDGEYRGFFKDGIRQGRGAWVYPEGLIVETYWSNGQPANKWYDGLIKWPNGDSYKGEIEDESPSGFGVLTLKSGYSLQAKFFRQGDIANGYQYAWRTSYTNYSEARYIETEGKLSFTFPNGEVFQTDKKTRLRVLSQYSSLKDWLFALQINATFEQFEGLKNRNINNEEDLQSVYKRMADLQYSTNQSLSEAIQFLLDEEIAKNSKSSPLLVKKKREEGLKREKQDQENVRIQNRDREKIALQKEKDREYREGQQAVFEMQCNSYKKARSECAVAANYSQCMDIKDPMWYVSRSFCH